MKKPTICTYPYAIMQACKKDLSARMYQVSRMTLYFCFCSAESEINEQTMELHRHFQFEFLGLPDVSSAKVHPEKRRRKCIRAGDFRRGKQEHYSPLSFSQVHVVGGACALHVCCVQWDVLLL